MNKFRSKPWTRPHRQGEITCQETGKLPQKYQQYTPGTFVRKGRELFCIRYAYRLRDPDTHELEWCFHLEERKNLKNPSTYLSQYCEDQTGKPVSLVRWTPIESSIVVDRYFPVYHYGNGLVVTPRTLKQYEVVSSGEIDTVDMKPELPQLPDPLMVDIMENDLPLSCAKED